MPLLTNDVWRGLLSTGLNRAMLRHKYGLAAFVFMPEHVHLLVFPLVGASKIDRLINAIKRPVSYRIKQSLIQHNSPLLKRLTIRQRPGVETFRYWQEGPGYDRNLETVQSFTPAVDYLHLNPVRRRLCSQARDWKWSSARHYESDGTIVDKDLPTISAVPPHWFDSV